MILWLHTSHKLYLTAQWEILSSNRKYRGIMLSLTKFPMLTTSKRLFHISRFKGKLWVIRSLLYRIRFWQVNVYFRKRYTRFPLRYDFPDFSPSGRDGPTFAGGRDGPTFEWPNFWNRTLRTHSVILRGVHDTAIRTHSVILRGVIHFIAFYILDKKQKFTIGLE